MNLPVRSKTYLKWLLTQPALCDHKTEVYAHQPLDGSSKGKKPSDLYAVPLCDTCHKIEHQEGRLSFWTNVFRLPETTKTFECKERVNGLLALECIKLANRFLVEDLLPKKNLTRKFSRQKKAADFSVR